METEKIHYLCASLYLPTLGMASSCQEGEDKANAIGHFYVKAADETLAGAIAADICRIKGVHFVDYLCLATPVKCGVIEHSDEHRIAYEKANEVERAVVVSVVLGNNLEVLNLTPYVR